VGVGAVSSGRPHPLAVFAVKSVHTAIFVVMLTSILWLAPRELERLNHAIGTLEA
jgi:hypothetical protein